MKSIKHIICIPIILFTISSLSAQLIPFTEKVYNDWIEMRIGNGEAVYWSSFGEVYTYPDGELIARMVGVDMGVKIEITPDSILQTSRKIFIYTDPETGSILKEYDGQEVSHIQYPYQLISYVRDNDKLRTWVVQGKGDDIRVIGPGTQIRARQMGKSVFYSAPLFLNMDTPRGKYQAFENYDFTYNPTGQELEDKYQISWMRYGDLPRFAGKGKAITHMISHRVSTFEDLESELINYINTKAPLWKKPPMNLNEIHVLQTGKE